MTDANLKVVVIGVSLLTLAMIPAVTVLAQDINQQTSMSNPVMNKVIHHRLVGMLAEKRALKNKKKQKRNALNEVGDELRQDTSAWQNGQQVPVGGSQGCGVDIGNVGSTGVSGQADQEIVIVGDVINVCN